LSGLGIVRKNRRLSKHLSAR